MIVSRCGREYRMSNSKNITGTDDARLGAPVRSSKVFICDDHQLVCDGLAAAIETQSDLSVAGWAVDARAAMEKIAECKPDVVLLDLSLKGESGLELLRVLRASGNQVPVLVLSMHREDLYASSTLRCGAQGYIMKEQGVDAILNALRKVLRGDLYLSEPQTGRLLAAMTRPGKVDLTCGGLGRLSARELEIFECIGRGLNSGETSRKLHISPRTVESHRTHIKVKLGLKTRAEMLHSAIRWVESEGQHMPDPVPPRDAPQPRTVRRKR